MSKLNHKYLLLAVLAASPFVALSPSKLIVKRTMASLEENKPEVSSTVSEEIVNTSEEVKKSINSTEQVEEAQEEKVEKEVKEDAQPQLTEVSEDDKEKLKQCSARDEIENLEKEVEKVVGENLKLIERFEKLNSKYDDQLKVTKKKVDEIEGVAAPEVGQSDLMIISLLSMILQNQQAPSYSYLPSAFSYAPQFTGPGWNFLPNHNTYRAPGSLGGYSSWEQEYYNIPSLGFVNPALTPKADSLTTGLYPTIYSSNGDGRALRSVNEIAPARGYQPTFLSPTATSNRQAQTEGFSF